MTDKLATTGEAARAIGVSTRSLARWAQDGTLKPAVRTPGGHFRWDIDELRRQLAGGESVGVSNEPEAPRGGQLPGE